MWDTDKLGKILNKPCHDYSDPMDAIRYALSSFKRTKGTDDKEYQQAINKLIKPPNDLSHLSPESSGYMKIEDYTASIKNLL